MEAGNLTVETVGSDHITEDSVILHGDLVEHPNPNSSIEVTGTDLDPDVSGNYSYNGTYNNGGVWISENDTWKISLCEDGINWIISDEVGIKCNLAEFSKLADQPPKGYWIEEKGTGTPYSEVQGNIVNTYFEYRKEDSILWYETNRTERVSPTEFYDKVTELEEETTYVYRAVAVWEDEMDVGEIKTFSTESREVSEEVLHKEVNTVLVVIVIATLGITGLGIAYESNLLYLSGIFWIITGSVLISGKLNMEYPYLFILFTLMGGLMVVVASLESIGETS